MLQIGSDYAWLWVAIEPVHKQVLGLHVSRHRNMLVAENFLRSLIKVYGKDILYIQMADHGILKHFLLYWSETPTSYSPLEKKVSQKDQLDISKR
jgi:hypothetical protein